MLVFRHNFRHPHAQRHTFIPRTHAPPPFTASQGHLFFSSPHLLRLSLFLCCSHPLPCPSPPLPRVTSYFFFCLHLTSFPPLLPLPSLSPGPLSSLCPLFHPSFMSLTFFLSPSLSSSSSSTFSFSFSLPLLNLPPLLLLHPPSAVSGPGASCGLPYSISHFYPSSTPFLIFTLSLFPFSFLSFPLTL